MKDQISHHLGTMPAETRIDIYRDFGVDVSQYKSWKGKKLALEEIHGS